MCGIIGATGDRPALPLLLEGLARLDYRGYDSSGVALQCEGGLWRERRKGKLSELEAAVGDAPRDSTAGIGHTRWATHGRPSDENAHPHTDCTGRLALIHNGIIENYLQLGDEVVAAGHELTSETDTEVLVHLIEAEMAGGAGLADALRTCLKRVEGSFAVACVHADEPDLIVAARRGSPLIAGLTESTGFVASDIPAILNHTREVYVIDDDHVVEARPGSLRVTTLDGEQVQPVRRHVDWDLEAAEKGDYETFMLKEIHEQPLAIRETLRGRLLPNGTLRLDEVRLSDDELRDIDKIFIIGCGTSYYAGLVARHAIEHWARLAVESEIASEFRYRDPVLDRNTLVIAVAQSGETLDTMEAVRHAKRQDARILAVVNVVDSSIAREADAVLYTRAGPEVGVASSKTHVSQIAAMEVLALYLAQLRGTLYPAEVQKLLGGLGAVPDLVAETLTRVEDYSAVARKYVDTRDFFFLGRNVGFAVAQEGALKLKELSYARAEAYPGGELKHGPIALIESGTVVVAVATRGRLLPKIISNIQEVKARGATVIVVANDGDDETASHADEVLWVPETASELFAPAVDVVPLQLFAYRIAEARGNDIDKPRNLAKTVTVE
ncbi:MAG TPA: glutamine--fructose-6-phosphate transaminase (isomerizing) [Acidimicrobiales bacterium]|nr:glutamine--fructose-6-phosphate transaminase (isomerizing) [Acidimicrobiales bacterium]